MRDLYATLKLNPAAPDAQIRAAITACPHAELRSDAVAVLLDAGRRQSYDQLHSTLTTIGSLRASLGMVQTRFWQGQRAFDGEITGSGSRYGEFLRKRDLVAAARRREVVESGTASPIKKFIGALRPGRPIST